MKRVTARSARVGLGVCLAAVAGCSSGPHDGGASLEAGCTAAQGQAIVNGSAEETYLGLAPSQTLAIVQIVDTANPPQKGGPLCSGTFLASGWVVTAAHCLQIESPAVLVGTGSPGAAATLAVVGTFANPDEDVALLQVAPSVDAGLSDMVPIGVAGSSVGKLVPGEAVEIAGYGGTATGSSGTLQFAVEPIARMDATSITVSGHGMNGACDGDSGGPLLVRGPDGAVLVAGVLSIGSATCRDDDTYERLDAVAAWIDGLVGPATPVNAGCGGITQKGRCLYGSALWCEGGILSAQACSSGESCGWDQRNAGFRCVAPSEDPCRGVDSVGACLNGRANWCDGGSLEQANCGCGACEIDGQSGRPLCGPPLQNTGG
jgi:hypothetical protein